EIQPAVCAAGGHGQIGREVVRRGQREQPCGQPRDVRDQQGRQDCVRGPEGKPRDACRGIAHGFEWFDAIGQKPLWRHGGVSRDQIHSRPGSIVVWSVAMKLLAYIACGLVLVVGTLTSLKKASRLTDESSFLWDENDYHALAANYAMGHG